MMPPSSWAVIVQVEQQSVLSRTIDLLKQIDGARTPATGPSVQPTGPWRGLSTTTCPCTLLALGGARPLHLPSTVEGVDPPPRDDSSQNTCFSSLLQHVILPSTTRDPPFNNRGDGDAQRHKSNNTLPCRSRQVVERDVVAPSVDRSKLLRHSVECCASECALVASAEHNKSTRCCVDLLEVCV